MNAASPATNPHVPVLIEQVVEALAIAPGETHVDGTFGAGGYTRALIEHGAARIFAFDRDPDAIQSGEALVSSSGGRLTLVPERFSRMRQALSDRGVEAVDGVTLDIGVLRCSSIGRAWLLLPGRRSRSTCAWSQDGESAADFLNDAGEGEIADVIFQYGEEPKSRRIARAIVAGRPIESTGSSPTSSQGDGPQAGAKKDPATRTFQAIRIHINDELASSWAGWRPPSRCLLPAAALAVVTFHSLEDRIVKRFL
jgi:16S rRNA (cytosine1402-N4)-methyltransferase